MDAVSDKFVELLTTAWNQLVEPSEEQLGNLRLACDAVAESVTLYERRCFFAATLQGVFADHYKEHALALADHFVNSFLRLEVSSGSPLRDPRALVLTFCAFAWHDAGMAWLPESSDPDQIEAILRMVKVRQEHDRRSVEVLDAVDLGAELPCWTHFWSKCGGPSWPRPAELYARDLLSRICLSHGDGMPEWLSEESFNTYRRANSGADVSFKEAFGDSWEDMRPLALAAAAALNLCDLLDIRKARLRLPRERELDRFVAESLEDRRQTLLHWAAHQVLSVEPKSEKIELVAHPGREFSRLSVQLVSHSGPGKALLSYGNSQRLIDVLRRIGGVRYSGVELLRGAVDDQAWREISDRLASPTFRDCWSGPRQVLTTATGNAAQPILEQVAQVEWWNQLAGDLGEAGGDDALPPGPISSELRIVLKALRSRIPLEELVEVDPVLSQPGPVLVTADADISGGERVAECFIGGLALVKHFLGSPEMPPVNAQIHLAFRGNETHRKLTAGEFAGKNSGKNVVFVCVRPNADLSDYATVINNRHKWPLVIFCCGSVEQERWLRRGVQSITVRPLYERLESVAQSISSIDVRDDPAVVSFGPSVTGPSSSVVSLLLDLCNQGSGGELIRHQIIDGLSDRAGRDRSRARSLVFWIAMLELFDGSTDAADEIERAVGFWASQLPRTIELLAPDQLERLIGGRPPFMTVSPASVSNEDDLGEIDLLQVMRRQILAEAFDLVPEIELTQIAEVFIAVAQGRWARVDCTGIARQGLALRALILILDACLLRPVAQDSEFEPDESDIDLSIRAIESFALNGSASEVIEVLRYLDRVCPVFTASSLAILAFQLSYRLARGMEDLEKVGLDAVGDVVRLGIFEAIASSQATDEHEQRSWGEIVAAITVDCRRRAEQSGIDDYVLMLYDICIKYRSRESFPEAAAEPLLSFGAEHDLEATAAYFHGSSDEAVLTVAATQRGVLFHKWRELRACLLDLMRSTPREYRRERVSSAAELRSRPNLAKSA